MLSLVVWCFVFHSVASTELALNFLRLNACLKCMEKENTTFMINEVQDECVLRNNIIELSEKQEGSYVCTLQACLDPFVLFNYKNEDLLCGTDASDLPWEKYERSRRRTSKNSFRLSEHAVWENKEKHQLNAFLLNECLLCHKNMENTFFVRKDQESTLPGLCLDRNIIKQQSGLINGSYFCNAAQCYDEFTIETYQITDLQCTEDTYDLPYLYVEEVNSHAEVDEVKEIEKIVIQVFDLFNV